MVAYKSKKSGIRQYLKDKPNNWGFKLWIKASKDGYCCINIPTDWWKKSKNSKINGKDEEDQDPISSEPEEDPLLSSIQASDDSSDMDFEPTQSYLHSSKDQILAQFHQPKVLSRVD